MDLQGYLRVIRKHWWIILITTVLGAGTGVLFNVRSTPLYESSVTFYVSTPSDQAGTSAYQANQYALAKIQSYSKLLNSERLANMIIQKTGVTMSPQALGAEIAPASDLNTVLLTATVTDISANRSLLISTAIATEFGTMVDQLDNRTTKSVTGSTVVLNVTSGPTLNPTPVSPKTRTNIALGLIAGLLIGIGLAILRGLMDTTIRSLDSLRLITGLPALGSVAFDSSAKKSPVLLGDQLRSVRAEAFRQLRTNLQFVDVDNPVQVLVVTSSVAGEGKSTTTVNLAVVAAETGRKVLIIEADLRRPRVAVYLGLEQAVGLTNVLAGQVTIADVLQPWGTDGLMVMPCGSIPPNPSELLGSHNMVDLLDELRGMFDMIIIDTPPLLPVTDGAVAATRADGVLVVVRYGKTTRSQINGSLHSLEAVDARILGCVITMLPKKGADATGYDGYGYYEDDPKKVLTRNLPTVTGAAPQPLSEAGPPVPVQSVAGAVHAESFAPADDAPTPTARR